MTFLRGLPWTWITMAAAAVVVLLLARRWWRGGGDRSRRGYGGGYGAGHGADSGQGHGAALSGEQRALLNAANAVREALDRQSREMQELRAFWSKRFDELNRTVAELGQARQRHERDPAAERRQGAGGGGTGGDYGGGYGGGYDDGTYGAESLGRTISLAEPAWTPSPADQPVEIRDGVLVASRSLPPAGYLSLAGGGQARVYLNADVPLSEFALPKWAGFFELQGARPYAAYRTVKPAEVRWDEGMGRGELISKGLAEAI